MIPSQEEISQHQQEVRSGLEARGTPIPAMWKVEIEVKPYLFSDIAYGIRRNNDEEPTGIFFRVYSARYPSTWYNWLALSLDEIAEYLKKMDIGGASA